MADALELKVIFSAVDKFLHPVKRITEAARDASKAFNEQRDRLKELNGTLGKIDGFEKVRRDAAIAANTLKSTQAKIEALREEMKKTGGSEAMNKEMSRLQSNATKLTDDIDKLRRHEYDLQTALKIAGIDTKNLADARNQLGSASSAAAMDSARLQAALDAENKKMQRVKAAQADLNKARETAGKWAMRGAGITAAGVAVGLPIGKATKDFADFETAMLGVARQVEGARDANGKLTATYFEIGDAVKVMSERLPGTANDIAAIVTAGARMGIQGKENLLTFAETTAVMASAFDLPVDQIGEDMGKISQLYKVPIKDIQALGDTINWLDDNAQSKGADIIDVMKRIAANATTAGMSYKEAAALGSTFLSLGASAEVAASASNAMIRELSTATMQSKRFRDGAAMLNLDLKALQKNASIDPTGTIIRVMEAINKLPKERQIEAATRMFGKEFGDDAAKLAGNLDEYRKQLALVNDEKARGSMGREGDARNQTLNERMDNVNNAFTNLSSDLGKTLQPALVETLEKTLAIVQGIRSWSKENPELTDGIMTVGKWLAIGLSVIGGLFLAASAILVPLAMMNFGLAAIGISSGGAATGLMALLAPLAKVALAFAAGYALGTLLNEGINRGLSAILGYETTLGASLFDLVEGIKTKFGDLVSWFKALPQRLSEAGAAMIDGLINGFQQRWDALKSAVVGIADGAIGWFKDKLGIHSPSRVFAQLGGYTMEGFEQGLTGAIGGPLGAVSSLAKQLAGIGAGVVIGGSAAAGGVEFDTRPPLGQAALSSAAAAAPMQVTINVYGAPGQDTSDIQRKVEQALANAEAKRAAQRRSRLRDPE